MLLTILLVLGLVATPVATPVLPAIQPNTTVVLSSSAIVRPLIADGVIYIATGSRDILAIDSDTGATLWTTPLQTAASDELMKVASTPRHNSVSTWSFINAIKGDSTIVTGARSAGGAAASARAGT